MRFDSGLEHWIGFRGRANGERQRKADSTPIDNALALREGSNTGVALIC